MENLTEVFCFKKLFLFLIFPFFVGAERVSEQGQLIWFLVSVYHALEIQAWLFAVVFVSPIFKQRAVL